MGSKIIKNYTCKYCYSLQQTIFFHVACIYIIFIVHFISNCLWYIKNVLLGFVVNLRKVAWQGQTYILQRNTIHLLTGSPAVFPIQFSFFIRRLIALQPELAI